jgi:hypothetical protein
MPIIRLLEQEAMDPDTTRLLASAFEAAWQVVRASGSPLADEPHIVSTRDLLAKRVIELGQRDERDYNRLVEGAVTYLAKSRLEQR